MWSSESKVETISSLKLPAVLLFMQLWTQMSFFTAVYTTEQNSNPLFQPAEWYLLKDSLFIWRGSDVQTVWNSADYCHFLKEIEKLDWR